jgi:hypothetical protein
MPKATALVGRDRSIPEITTDSQSECTVPNQNTELDISAQGTFGKVGRVYEFCFIVGDNGLRMKNAISTFVVKRSRVVKQDWARRSGPVSVPENGPRTSAPSLLKRQYLPSYVEYSRERSLWSGVPFLKMRAFLVIVADVFRSESKRFRWRSSIAIT